MLIADCMFAVNVEAAIRKDGKWLIIERSKKEQHAGGMLSLVGGTVEQEGASSDILERAVRREVLEEVDIVLKKELIYVNNSSFITDTGVHVINIVFFGEHESGEAVAKSPDEVERIWWLTTEEVLQHQSAPAYLKESVEKADLLI